MSGDAFSKRRQAFEEEFFNKYNQKLVDKLRVTLEKQHTREELEQLTGIHDPAVLDTLMALHVDKSTFAAFGLYPLVEVAWADGKVDEKERQAFIAAAAEHGITPGSFAHTALEEFMQEHAARGCPQGLVRLGGDAEPARSTPRSARRFARAW